MCAYCRLGTPPISELGSTGIYVDHAPGFWSSFIYGNTSHVLGRRHRRECFRSKSAMRRANLTEPGPVYLRYGFHFFVERGIQGGKMQELKVMWDQSVSGSPVLESSPRRSRLVGAKISWWTGIHVWHEIFSEQYVHGNFSSFSIFFPGAVDNNEKNRYATMMTRH